MIDRNLLKVLVVWLPLLAIGVCAILVAFGFSVIFPVSETPGLPRVARPPEKEDITLSPSSDKDSSSSISPLSVSGPTDGSAQRPGFETAIPAQLLPAGVEAVPGQTKSNISPDTNGSYNFKKSWESILRTLCPHERRLLIIHTLAQTVSPSERARFITLDCLEDRFFAAEAWELLQKYGLEDEVILSSCASYLRGFQGKMWIDQEGLNCMTFLGYTRCFDNPNLLAWVLHAARTGVNEAVRATAYRLLSGDAKHSAWVFGELATVAEKDPEPLVRMSAIRAMRTSENPELLGTWSRLLTVEKHPRVLVELIVWLRQLFPAEAESLAKLFMAHENLVVRDAAQGKLRDRILSGQGLSLGMDEYQPEEKEDNGPPYPEVGPE
jgi:hypothetical protein